MCKKPVSMSAERLEFGPSVRGLFIDTFGATLTVELKGAMRAQGLDLDRPLQPSYPAASYVACVRLMARALSPELTEDDALRVMGGRAVEGLSSNFLGRSLLSVVRAMGLRRTLLHTERAFRNSNNYTRVEAQVMSPTSVELTFNTVMGLPTYIEGVLLAAPKLLGGREPRVESTPLDGERHRFVLHWKE